jgi:hypothetical protein
MGYAAHPVMCGTDQLMRRVDLPIGRWFTAASSRRLLVMIVNSKGGL